MVSYRKTIPGTKVTVEMIGRAQAGSGDRSCGDHRTANLPEVKKAVTVYLEGYSIGVVDPTLPAAIKQLKR